MTTNTIQSAMILTTFALFVHAQTPKPAEPAVAAANRAVLSQLPFADRQDFEDATNGFIATTPDARNPTMYDFLKLGLTP